MGSRQIRQSFTLLLALLLFLPASAQTDTTASASPEVSFTGFADIFYAYDFNEPALGYRQPFLYNHNRHNEFNLNLALLKVSVNHPRYRGNIALQAGTYAMDNYAAEEELLQHVFEANAGIAITPDRRLWLDAGILGSHIGFESAVLADNLTLTRSLLAENSPYFLSGAKFTYTPTPAWTVAAVVANGWQRIKRVPGNSLPSFGTQVNYSPSQALALNWSTFIGTDDPDSNRRMRYFNNLYAQLGISEKLILITGFDIGLQQEQKGSNHYDVWYSPVAIAKYKLSSAWSVAGRAEYYQDKKGVIIPSPAGFQVSGFSLNTDYAPRPNIICRLEGRWLNGSKPTFSEGASLTETNLFITSSIALKITK
ncbi:porin [Pontibacter litorisediminis]|uniref:porin n=1 Tax=Pontibacter litorisediminis TaxID=1846260 RepID=UPI0023EDE225|nr:porin [Pontibacter litorisediminis]